MGTDCVGCAGYCVGYCEDSCGDLRKVLSRGATSSDVPLKRTPLAAVLRIDSRWARADTRQFNRMFSVSSRWDILVAWTRRYWEMAWLWVYLKNRVWSVWGCLAMGYKRKKAIRDDTEVFDWAFEKVELPLLRQEGLGQADRGGKTWICGHLSWGMVMQVHFLFWSVGEQSSLETEIPQHNNGH